MVLLDRSLKLDIKESVIEHLEQLDSWAIVLELVILAIMAISLGRLSLFAFGTWPGLLIPAFVVPVGLIFPLLVKRWADTRSAVTASVFVLVVVSFSAPRWSERPCQSSLSPRLADDPSSLRADPARRSRHHARLDALRLHQPRGRPPPRRRPGRRRRQLPRQANPRPQQDRRDEAGSRSVPDPVEWVKPTSII